MEMTQAATDYFDRVAAIGTKSGPDISPKRSANRPLRTRTCGRRWRWPTWGADRLPGRRIGAVGQRVHTLEARRR